MRLALDTNFLVYAEGVNSQSKEQIAEGIVSKLPTGTTYVPTQVLGELFRVLVRKARRTPKAARTSVLNWQESFPVIETSHSILMAAVDLSVDHDIGIWDSVVLAAAASVNCRLLLSEDMQEGFTWNGVTVVNPFAATWHELLTAALED